MQDSCKLSAKLGGLGIAALLRTLMGTLDYQVVHYDITADPARPEFRGRYIYIFWHEYITFPVTLWGNCDIAALVSLHRDGEWITRAARHLGFEIVRGSTTRGGVQAVRQLKRIGQQGNLTIMPDGPKGPRRKLAVGPVYLSSRFGIPLVPIGFGYERPWRMPTWDRFAVPRPFSRARSILGPPVPIPPRLGRAALEHYRVRVQTLLNRLTEQAESWAASGRRRVDQRPIRRWPKLPGVLRFDSAHPSAQQPAADPFIVRRRPGPLRTRRPLRASGED